MQEKKEHQKDLLPKSFVQSDINLERWCLFSTKKGHGHRVMERKRTNPDGTIVRQKVTIGLPGIKHTLTAEEAKVFYLLLDRWDKAGRDPNGVIHGSFREVYLTLHGRTGREQGKSASLGNYEKQWFIKKLDRLLQTLITYEEAYQTPKGEFLTKETFTLLNRIDLFDRKKNKKKLYYDLSHFTIHPMIVKSILGHKIKPLRLDVIIQLKKEISVILYRFLDLILFDKVQYERNIEQLAEELGFGASLRKNLLKQLRAACLELTGKDLSAGRIESCQIEKTVNGKDWKLIVRKGKQVLSLNSTQSIEPETSTIDQEERDLLVYHQSLSQEEQAKLATIAEEIVRSKYRFGGSLSQRFALLDALRDHRQTAATPMFESLAIEPN